MNKINMTFLNWVIIPSVLPTKNNRVCFDLEIRLLRQSAFLLKYLRQLLPDNSLSDMAAAGGFPGGGGGAPAGLVWGRLFSPLEVPVASLRGTLAAGTSSACPL